MQGLLLPAPLNRTLLERLTQHGLNCETIAQLAYDKWLQRGATHGDDLRDWLEAEAELTQLIQHWREPDSLAHDGADEMCRLRSQPVRSQVRMDNAEALCSISGLDAIIQADPSDGSPMEGDESLNTLATLRDQQNREVACIEVREDLSFRLISCASEESATTAILQSLSNSLHAKDPCVGADGEICFRDPKREPYGRVRLSEELSHLSEGRLHVVYDREVARRTIVIQAAMDPQEPAYSTEQLLCRLQALGR